MKIESQNGTADSVKNNKEIKDKKAYRGGSLKAAAAATAVQACATPLSLLGVKGMQNVTKNLSKEQIAQMNEAAEKMIKDTGLSAKGVKIKNLTYLDGGLNLTGLPDSVLEMKNPYYATAHGKNAAFLPKGIPGVCDANTIIINKEKLPAAAFHEIGHAFNKNSSKFWSSVQKMRTPAMAAATLLMLLPAFTKKETAQDGKELTKGQKAKNFVRDNSGILAGAAMLPVVSEEIMASVRGCKWANANLPKELAKKVKTTNIFGAVSYVGAAIGISLAAFAATKIKDKAVEKANNKDS